MPLSFLSRRQRRSRPFNSCLYYAYYVQRCSEGPGNLRGYCPCVVYELSVRDAHSNRGAGNMYANLRRRDIWRPLSPHHPQPFCRSRLPRDDPHMFGTHCLFITPHLVYIHTYIHTSGFTYRYCAAVATSRENRPGPLSYLCRGNLTEWGRNLR